MSLITNPAQCNNVQTQLLTDSCVSIKTIVGWIFGLWSCCIYVMACCKLGRRALSSVWKMDYYISHHLLTYRLVCCQVWSEKAKMGIQNAQLPLFFLCNINLSILSASMTLGDVREDIPPNYNKYYLWPSPSNKGSRKKFCNLYFFFNSYYVLMLFLFIFYL